MKLRLGSPVLDLVCLASFVAIGGRAHDMHAGAMWFVVVLWPLVVGWFAAAMWFRAYARTDINWRRLLPAWLVGMVLALILRVTITGRPAPVTFVVVLLVFTGITLLGWRLCAQFLLQLKTRADPP